MKQHELKAIRDELKFGDVTTIAKEVGVTAQTVQNALRGIQRNDTAKLIIKHAQKIIQQRTDRLAFVQRELAKQRAAREKAGLQ